MTDLQSRVIAGAGHNGTSARTARSVLTPLGSVPLGRRPNDFAPACSFQSGRCCRPRAGQ